MNTTFYVLRDKIPVAVNWEEFLAEDRFTSIIRRTELPGDVLVSTVFLNVARDGRMFETMIFGSHHHGYQLRYATYDEAVAGHEKIVEYMRSMKPQKHFTLERNRNANRIHNLYRTRFTDYDNLYL
jgi:hypothetical protein